MTKSFQCKQFAIIQEKSAMKVGTDGLLLGSWSEVNSAQHILDIGTGTGILSLMVAQRNSNALIEAIDIDKEAATEAAYNIHNSPWGSRIRVTNISLQEYNPSIKFDHIICNPPFFNNSTKSPNISRSIARDNSTLSPTTLLSKSSELSQNYGTLSLILPADNEREIINNGYIYGWNIHKIVRVHPTPQHQAKRVLLQFCKESKDIVEDKLTIELARHKYSDEYKRLTIDFYLYGFKESV